MGKGGRYLKKEERKKGRGWKIALTVFVVLLVLIGGGVFIVTRYYNDMLSKINRAEVIEKDVSIEDILNAAAFNPDKETEDSPQTSAGMTEPDALPSTGTDADTAE